jgi:hypothetical protein
MVEAEVVGVKVVAEVVGVKVVAEVVGVKVVASSRPHSHPTMVQATTR